jgi:hypothetical protein
LRLLIAIATTVALTGTAFAADLGPVPAKPRQHSVQRYAPVPDQDDNYAAPPGPRSAPTCPNRFAGAAPMCAGAAYGTPCGAGYGYGVPFYPGVMTAYGYGNPYFGGGRFGHHFGRGRR